MFEHLHTRVSTTTQPLKTPPWVFHYPFHVKMVLDFVITNAIIGKIGGKPDLEDKNSIKLTSSLYKRSIISVEVWLECILGYL